MKFNQTLKIIVLFIKKRHPQREILTDALRFHFYTKVWKYLWLSKAVIFHKTDLIIGNYPRCFYYQLNKVEGLSWSLEREIKIIDW